LNLQALSWKLPKRDRLLVLTEHHRISDDSLQPTETWGISLLPGVVTVRCLLRLHDIQMAASLMKCAANTLGKRKQTKSRTFAVARTSTFWGRFGGLASTISLRCVR